MHLKNLRFRGAARVTIQATGLGGGASVRVAVTLVVAEQVEEVFLPMILRETVITSKETC